MASLYTTMWTYPWDLRDEGCRRVLRDLKGEIGLNAINLASAYHTFDMLRPHLPARNTLVVPEAAVYFQPQLDLYKNTAIKPHVSPLMHSENWYADAARETANVGLDLIAWTVFFHNSHQAQRHPECAIVRCTGDHSPSGLCPANPDVRAYALALSQDLVKNYGIKTLECESLDYQGWGHTHHHLKHGILLGDGGRFLFSLCFCNACTEQATQKGLDIDHLQKTIAEKIHNVFATGQPLDDSPEALKAEMPELNAFIDMRETVVSSLVQELREAIDTPLSFILMGNPDLSGTNPKAIAQIADGIEILSYTSDPQRTRDAVLARQPLLHTPQQLLVGLQAYPPASPDAETLFQNLEAAHSLGVRRFAFYNYGIMPMPNLNWVRQAITRGEALAS